MASEHSILMPRPYAKGEWVVGARLASGQIAIGSCAPRYASVADANLAAIQENRAKPFMNYVAVRA